jgi:nicotinate-nucleotide pyrophosphorylase (carboxylating)
MTAAHPPLHEVRRVVAAALAEDLTPMGDLTSALLPAGAEATASYVARAPGRLAGRLAASEVLAQVDGDLEVAWLLDDGDELVAGAVIGTVTGSFASILTAERTSLDFLTHLSGVATLARAYVDRAEGGQTDGRRCRVLDTRKTLPGLRALQKAAVRAGGAHNHRGSLSEMVLLKDNHLVGITIAEAVRLARDRWPARTIEVECDHMDQVEAAGGAGADMVLLDNMGPDAVADAVAWVRAHDGRCLVEVSGGVDLTTVEAFAAAGPDFVSVGALTHSAPALDIGLDIDAGIGVDKGWSAALD